MGFLYRTHFAAKAQRRKAIPLRDLRFRGDKLYNKSKTEIPVCQEAVSKQLINQYKYL